MPGYLTSEAYIEFVERLRAFRVEQGITQEQMAQRLSRPQSYVSKTERRERRLDVMEFIEWADALGVAPEELLARLRTRAQA